MLSTIQTHNKEMVFVPKNLKFKQTMSRRGDRETLSCPRSHSRLAAKTGREFVLPASQYSAPSTELHCFSVVMLLKFWVSH